MPPAELWPDVAERMRDDPPAHLYSFADRCRQARYVRLDHATDRQATLERAKAFLAAGFPLVLGFPVSREISGEPDIPYSTRPGGIRGGHAVLVVGYDDQRRIGSQRGSLLIHNSWGDAWGDGGYGWLPYAYVTHGLAVDLWTLLDKPGWRRVNLRDREPQLPRDETSRKAVLDSASSNPHCQIRAPTPVESSAVHSSLPTASRSRPFAAHAGSPSMLARRLEAATVAQAMTVAVSLTRFEKVTLNLSSPIA